MRALKVERRWKKDSYTIGIFSVDGKRWCESLEDKDRGLSDDMTLQQIRAAKVYAETAIPKGRYEVELTFSPKFSTRTWGKIYDGLVPEILNVKGFDKVRIHPLNTPEDSKGCIGIGENTIKGQITSSSVWYYRLMNDVMLPAKQNNEKVILEIV